MVNIGEKVDNFDLLAVDGRNHTLDQYSKKTVVVIFTCNHCPYAKAYEERIIKIQEDYDDIQVIAINSNDDVGYPEDSFENMKVRAKEKEFNFPYLRDENQEVARDYGAEVTPHAFLIEDGILKYKGRIDDNWEDENKVQVKDLRNAIEALKSGKEVKVKEAKSVGCSIKWK